MCTSQWWNIHIKSRILKPIILYGQEVLFEMGIQGNLTETYWLQKVVWFSLILDWAPHKSPKKYSSRDTVPLSIFLSSQRTGQLRVLSFKVAVTLMCKGPLEEKYRCKFYSWFWTINFTGKITPCIHNGRKTFIYLRSSYWTYCFYFLLISRKI